jgi:hypothetical protein
MAVGPGYRGTLGDLSRYDVHGAWSLKNYKTVDGFVRLSEIGDGQVRIDLRGSWLDAPEVSFWGTGDGSSPENKTSYRHRATTAGAVARFQATKVFAVGGGFDATAYDIGHGAGATSVEERFSLEELPGLSVNTNYIKTQVFAEADSRRSPGYTRRGGLYRVEWHEYRETSNGPFSFHRFDAEVNQFLPVLRENWVIALRALTTLTGTDTGQRVPFFLLPDLGGGTRTPRLFVVAVPRPSADSVDRRVPLDRRQLRGYGAVSRCGQGRGGAVGRQSRRVAHDVWYRCALSHAPVDRPCEWSSRTPTRGMASCSPSARPFEP